MDINHGVQASGQDSNPFTVVPDNVIVDSSQVGRSFTVTLSTSSGSFMGFMLDARQCDSCLPAGVFSVLDPMKSLLICGGQAVAQPDNTDKNSVQVNWTPQTTGQFFFRSAFIKDYSTFWLKKAIILPTTTTPTTTTTTTTTTPTTTTTTRPTTTTPTIPTTTTPTRPATTTPTGPTTTTATVTSTPSPLAQCVKYMRSCVVLLLLSRLCFLGGSSLLMIIKPVSKMPTKIASIIEVALKFVATVLVLIKAVHHECKDAGLQTEFAALIVTAMVTGLMHTIIVFFYRGPSDELRTCWIGSLITVDLLNTIITSVSIFYGLWWFQEHWMPILMGVYVFLEFILYLGAVCFQQMEKRKAERKNITALKHRKLSWRFMFVICLVFYIMITVALIAGVSSHVM
nr:cell wall integrity and stress response component 4-like [Danio rerio]|eukprot:XP_021334224.1 cell wall integrity and stress response component 4-like [Danio rerio]